MENFISTYNVSRETFLKLETYVTLLKDWQKKFNLVSNSSLPDVWTRHIADSAELFKHIPQNAKRLYDMGSGAGFPALVLAVMAQELSPELRITLIESITKKTLFLNKVKTVLNLKNVNIVNDRAENLKPSSVDVITARAMTALDGLFKYASRFCTRETVLIFPKGRSYQSEIDEALKHWNFHVEVLPNPVSEDGVILKIKNLRRK